MGYEELFTPFKIGTMEVKNRLVMSPMGTNSSFTNGRKDAQEIDYFTERAKGGVGMIILGCQMLNEQIAQGSMEGYLDTYTVLPSLTAMCDSVNRYGTKIVCQIHKYGKHKSCAGFMGIFKLFLSDEGYFFHLTITIP